MSDLINRQDAIELIHSLYPSAPIMRMNRERWKKKYEPYIEVEKALEMLPSADASLMQDRCKFDASSDLISRQALRDAMYHEAFETDTEMQKWDSGCWIRYKLFENCIDSMPTIEPEQKKGKWIEKHHAYSDEESVIEEWQSCRCSECGRYDTRPYMYYFSEPNYCSYCGADMRGE